MAHLRLENFIEMGKRRVEDAIEKQEKEYIMESEGLQKDDDEEQTDNPRMLPVVEIDDKTYFYDKRLNELRRTTNPLERFDLENMEAVTEDKDGTLKTDSITVGQWNMIDAQIYGIPNGESKYDLKNYEHLATRGTAIKKEVQEEDADKEETVDDNADEKLKTESPDFDQEQTEQLEAFAEKHTFDEVPHEFSDDVNKIESDPEDFSHEMVPYEKSELYENTYDTAMQKRKNSTNYDSEVASY